MSLSTADLARRPWLQIKRRILSSHSALKVLLPWFWDAIASSRSTFDCDFAASYLSRSAGEKFRWWTSSTRGGSWTTALVRLIVIARTRALSLKNPWASVLWRFCQGLMISSSKILGSEYGWTLKNLTILAKSVSLFWIGVPVIAHRLVEWRWQQAWASWLCGFCIVWAVIVSYA